MAGDDSIHRWPTKNNADRFITDKTIHRTKHPSIDSTNDSIQRSSRSSGGFMTDVDKDFRSISSRYSVDSQRPKPPPPGTYLVQLPRDQIYRIPPPENAHRYENLSRQKPNRSACRRCCCYFLAALLLLLTLALLLVGIFFLVCRPHKPLFSVSGLSVAGVNLTSSSSSPFSPEINIKVRSKNVNDRLGLIYGRGSAAEMFYDGIKLGDGEFTPFDQPAENVTVTVMTLRGSRIQLTSSTRKDLTDSQKKGKVPFDLRIKAPLKFKVGAATTWTMVVTVDCKLTVDKLTPSATVISENCVTEDIRLL